MKQRLPAITSFILFILLCATSAYWVLQFWRPPVRALAAPAPELVAMVSPEAAASLFGGRPSAVGTASNYQLRGVVVADNGRESVAIISADGKPAQAVGLNVEFQPGVSVREVHPRYILLSEGGVSKRVALPAEARSSEFNPNLTPGLTPLMPPAMPAAPQLQLAPQPPVQVVAPVFGQMSSEMAIPPVASPQMPPPAPAQGQPNAIPGARAQAPLNMPPALGVYPPGRPN